MNGGAEFRLADPAVAAVRLLWAFLLFAMGPSLVSMALLQSGLVAAPQGESARVEHALLAFGLTALGLGAFAAWQPPGPWRPWRPRLVVGSYLPLLLVWTAFLVAYLRGMHGLGHPVAPQQGLHYFALHDPATAGFWLCAAVTVFGAPLAEELVFRGYLHGVLRTRLGPWPAIGLGGALFGLLHGLDYALPITLLGVFFGWLRERSGALLPSLLAHALHNGVVVAVTAAWPASLDLLYPR